MDPAAPLRRHFLTSAAAAFSCSALSLATALAAHADDLDGTINRLEAAAGSGEAHISFVGWLTLACMGYWLVKAISYLFIDSQVRPTHACWYIWDGDMGLEGSERAPAQLYMCM